MFYASRGGFTSGILDLTETGKIDAISIGNLVLFDVMVKQYLGFQLLNEFIQGNVRETALSVNFVGFTRENGEYCSNLVLMRYIGCDELVRDGSKSIYELFIFLFGRKQVSED